ncbi:uncharacterized protein LOC105083732 [Camelus bactrianus]|uniref:Uncharacterized protein LOC105083732 n=1 Tax=Camelus bactrianus TaxID=9837 RepID=A0AC58PYG9_CAMBA
MKCCQWEAGEQPPRRAFRWPRRMVQSCAVAPPCGQLPQEEGCGRDPPRLGKPRELQFPERPRPLPVSGWTELSLNLCSRPLLLPNPAPSLLSPPRPRHAHTCTYIHRPPSTPTYLACSWRGRRGHPRATGGEAGGAPRADSAAAAWSRSSPGSTAPWTQQVSSAHCLFKLNFLSFPRSRSRPSDRLPAPALGRPACQEDWTAMAHLTSVGPGLETETDKNLRAKSQGELLIGVRGSPDLRISSYSIEKSNSGKPLRNLSPTR